MAAEETSVKITGDASEGSAAINEFAEQFEQAFSALTSGSIKDFLGAIGSIPAYLVIAAGAIAELGDKMVETVGETAKMTEANVSLGERLGIASSEAQALTAALDEVGVSSDTYAGASLRLSIQIKQHEAALNSMKLATRDSNHELLSETELMQNAITWLGTFKEGTDRNEAALYAFGRGASEASQLMRLHAQAVEEAKERISALGYATTNEGVTAMQQYRTAVAGVKEVGEGLTYQIGSQLMPVMTEFLEWIGTQGPGLVEALRKSIDLLAIAFDVLKNGVVVSAEAINLVVNTLANSLIGVWNAIGLAMKGHFMDAATALRTSAAAIETDWKNAFASIDESSMQTSEAIKKRFADLATAGNQAGTVTGPHSGGKDFHAPTPDKSQVPEMQAELDQQLLAQQLFGEKAKQYEEKFWQDKLAAATVGSATYKALLSKVYAAENADAIRNASQKQKIAEDQIKVEEEVGLEGVAAQQKMAQEEEKNGQISKTKLIQLEQQFEDQKFQIQSAALRARLQLAASDTTNDPSKVAAINGQIEILTKKHLDAMSLLTKQEADSQIQIWGRLGQSISKSLGDAFVGMLNGSMSFVNSLKKMWNELVTNFIQMTTKMVVMHLLGEREKTAATETSEEERLAIKLWGSIQSLAITAAEAIKEIAIRAYQAIAGAWAAISAIPYVGPFLAPGIALGTGAAIFALASQISSAEGGYDIPGGTNPMTQLHQREMVLPAPIADTVRNAMTNGGPTGGGSQNFHYHAAAGESPASIMNNRTAFVGMARQAVRSFAVK